MGGNTINRPAKWIFCFAVFLLSSFVKRAYLFLKKGDILMSDTDVLTAKNDTEKEVANDLYQALVNKRPLKVTEYEKKVTEFNTPSQS
ncbi:hypothetical protein ATX71_04945 [Oenococcus oeni]|uniref:Uncharacterized protein n=1 Tax=Oenococcus oeni AWRIB429 TaxID=655225 RepID=D3L9I6_OENOE|nr:hypothetical protein AWRIB429_1016 [Oenococcus oeni AWRIB429]KER91888.1 hypothetical protein HS16_01110 [Oenococcus oeni]KGH52179.1 hypothetical protein X325_07860 [Oenococcus oeni S11]KGH59009.1 hypothetical protein X289_00170 [Oenococcus oeni IOEB_B10]KGH59984.1 hypothetical protein X467_07320 [Oenococcus oeni S28]KGH64391.1 hypothetical protein X294_02945 [Oenococcus oeni IOEB_CiNe]KGH72707.1 hypothetical protein X282_05280 [Oenococcus oeni IOEB_0608]KGH86991.1 hypothetical protein X30